jgi:hypothetical protein
MQQTSFGGDTTADDVFEGTGLVGFEFGDAVTVATRCYESRDIDDEMT